jgi:hypothetical protein
MVNNHLIPLVQRTLNKKTFPVTDGIIKHIIHERHRHQREHNNNRLRGTSWNDREKRRKHANTRRTDVSKQSEYFCLLSFYYNFFFTYYLETGSKGKGDQQVVRKRRSVDQKISPGRTPSGPDRQPVSQPGAFGDR